MSWMLIEKIKDNEKIYTGSCIRFYDTEKSIEQLCALPIGRGNPLDYIISEVYNDRNYLQLVCLTNGEGGNINCILEKENGNGFVLGKEVKCRLSSDLYKVLIKKQPKIVIM